MRFLVLGAAAILCGCAATTEKHQYVSPGVATPANSIIDSTAYNREIRRQGMDYYCGSGSCDTLPVLLRAYAPIYPQVQLNAGINGNATIVFDVLEDGTLANFKVESASADPFANAAIEALKLWRFTPPTLNGKPVKTSSRQSFPFVAR